MNSFKLNYIYCKKMYRIAWRVIATNYVGCGHYCLSLEHAKHWIDAMNKKHPDMEHWIEEEGK